MSTLRERLAALADRWAGLTSDTITARALHIAASEVRQALAAPDPEPPGEEAPAITPHSLAGPSDPNWLGRQTDLVDRILMELCYKNPGTGQWEQKQASRFDLDLARQAVGKAVAWWDSRQRRREPGEEAKVAPQVLPHFPPICPECGHGQIQVIFQAPGKPLKGLAWACPCGYLETPCRCQFSGLPGSVI